MIIYNVIISAVFLVSLGLYIMINSEAGRENRESRKEKQNDNTLDEESHKRQVKNEI